MLNRLNDNIGVLSLKKEKSFTLKRKELVDALLDVYSEDSGESMQGLLRCLSSDNSLNGMSLDNGIICLHSNCDDLEQELFEVSDSIANSIEFALR